MSGTIELFLLAGVLTLMVMVWRLTKHIQIATRTTASALEAQRLAVEQRIAEMAQTTASAVAAQLLMIEQRLTHVLERLVPISSAKNGRDILECHDVPLNVALPQLFPGWQDVRPIFVATVFKSGTKLLEHIVEKLTGLEINAPTMSAGSDYESADPIVFECGKFFIWHNVPSDTVKARLIEAHARPIFLIRNIYDLAVSQYFHFAHDVDAEIGYATHTAGYFSQMGQDEGIALLLSGATSEQFNWHGFGYYLRQTQEILQFSKEYPCHIVVYDRLIQSKHCEIQRLAAFLNVELTDELLSGLIGSSSLNSMREARISAVGTGKHFRKGSPGDHVNVLKPWHYHMINQIKTIFAPRLDDLCEELGCGSVTATLVESSHPRAVPSNANGT